LPHHLSEACERNVAVQGAIQELEDVTEFGVVQIPAVEVVNARLKLLPVIMPDHIVSYSLKTSAIAAWFHVGMTGTFAALPQNRPSLSGDAVMNIFHI
jgi:hypothetical protein